jgi:CheY-like chemotaxis protein
MKHLNVLVVEDDALIGFLLGELLVEMGHGVCAIEATKAGAIAAALRHRPDLIIVDATLGDESGVAAMQTILETSRVPHVFVSGNISNVLTQRPHAVGLQKPYSESALASAMEEALAMAVSL